MNSEAYNNNPAFGGICNAPALFGGICNAVGDCFVPRSDAPSLLERAGGEVAIARTNNEAIRNVVIARRNDEAI
jgi:hypothetical protein